MTQMTTVPISKQKQKFLLSMKQLANNLLKIRWSSLKIKNW